MFIGLNLFHGNQFAQACGKLMQLQKSFDNWTYVSSSNALQVILTLMFFRMLALNNRSAI